MDFVKRIVLLMLVGMSLICSVYAGTAGYSYTNPDSADYMTVTFTGTSSGGTPVSWSWNFGDSTTGTGQSIQHTYEYIDTGSLIHSVNLTVTFDDNTTASFEDNINIDEPTLHASFTSDPAISLDKITGYAPLPVTVTDTTIGRHETDWNWGDGTDTSSVNPGSHTYQTSGTYTLRLTVTRDSSTSTYSRYVVVKEPDVTAAFSANITKGIAPLTVEFTDESSGDIDSWEWEIVGDGFSTTRTDENFVYTFEKADTYTVLLRASGTGGTDTEEKKDYITVTPNITASFKATPPLTGYAPLKVQFTDTSVGHPNITSWHWDFGDYRQSNEPNPLHTYQDAGTFTVILTVENDQGEISATKTDYITVKGEATPTPTKTPTPTPKVTLMPTPTTAVTADNSKETTLSAGGQTGTRIFGIPGTEFFRSEITKFYGLYKEYVYLVKHIGG
ncbi:PKD domain-containing protein [Methanoplanus sp. FWC-SCC4]|uniref:PKD domain-containing protein n=1 Tax=Methanochimaera problematica TaxID=2609417 RepID=A0AA97FFN8_9EURY|nr:PKD domain-containing protein [Methanoplanus sp. FWC-SCC4]WOF17153.1 PKD domain-containing protein [Methanoplanus sp. FWC-SCC4]